MLEHLITPYSEIHRTKLRPYARSYAENLRAQVVQLLRDSDAKIVSEFEERCRQRLVPAERARKMQALLARLNEIRKTGVAPALEDESVRFRETTPDGKEIELDLFETLDESRAFFSSHDLHRLARALPTELRITPENLTRIQTALRVGFDRAFIMPRTHVQLQPENELIERILKRGKKIAQQSSDYIPTIDRSISAAPQRRPKKKAYLILYQSGDAPPETFGMRPGAIMQRFLQEKWNGLTVQEWLVLSIRERELRGNSSWSGRFEWLIDSKSVNLYPHVRFADSGFSFNADNGSDLFTGARPTMIIGIED